ncbi:hypothetical protein HDU76_006868 [Blyttiomyces sp. JEL0837]|nr:hypothetical protein HDU76_006868 [Blyttiomyces sp. JEL0837]
MAVSLQDVDYEDDELSEAETGTILSDISCDDASVNNEEILNVEENDDVISPGMHLRVLNAAASLPLHMFKTVMEQAQFTENHVSGLLLQGYNCLENAIRGRQIDVLGYFLSTRDDFEHHILFPALHKGVLYNLEPYAILIVHKLANSGYYDAEVSTGWLQLMVDALDQKWDMDVILGIWVKMNDINVKLRFCEHVIDCELYNVVEKMREVDENFLRSMSRHS